MPRKKAQVVEEPSTKDITRRMLAHTGFSSIAEMSQNIMFATKEPLNPFAKKPFRPGVPSKLLRFDNAEIDGEIKPCVILEYLNGVYGETIERSHPLNTMFTALEFIPIGECSMTYIRKSKLERGL